MNQTETRKIVVANNIILHHVHSQAGSLEKALAECITNSEDAGATRIEITIDADGQHYCIADNGSGFESREAILKNFEKLGFDHTTEEELKKNRKFGRFGLGRAQLWSFSRNTWASGPFRMVVDLKENGMNYDLISDAEAVAGCTITGELYSPLDAAQVDVVRRELRDLMRYMAIEVVFNGDVISTPVSKQKWDKVTDEAYYRFADSGQLHIFNMGMLVRGYSASHYGISGVVVSRKELTLNVARNEIMQNRCKLYPSIVEELRSAAKARREVAKESMGADDRLHLLREHLRPDGGADSCCFDQRILLGCRGIYQSIGHVLSAFSGRICVSESHYSPAAERITNTKQAYVVAQRQLDELGLSAEDFINALNLRTKYTNFTLLDYDELAAANNSAGRLLANRELSRKQRIALKMLKGIGDRIRFAIHYYCQRNSYRTITPARMLHLGIKEGAGAWTDGDTYIAFDVNLACELLDGGIGGAYKAAMIIAHEYLHSDSSAADHHHDEAFFAAFYKFKFNAMREIMENCRSISARYTRELIKANLAIPDEVVNASMYGSDFGRLNTGIEKWDLTAA